MSASEEAKPNEVQQVEAQEEKVAVEGSPKKTDVEAEAPVQEAEKVEEKTDQPLE